MSPAEDATTTAADVAEVIEARVSTFRAVLTAIAEHGISAGSSVLSFPGHVGIHARNVEGARVGPDAAVRLLADLAPGVEPSRRDLPAGSVSFSAGGFTVYAELHAEARS